jgi:hypothetical protein
MLRRSLLTLAFSAAVTACDRSEPRIGAAPSMPAASQTEVDATGRLRIQVELQLEEGDSKDRVSAEIDRAFAGRPEVARACEEGEWRVDVVAAFHSPGKGSDEETVRCAYEILPVPPTAIARVDAHGHHRSSSSRGSFICKTTEFATRFEGVLADLERRARLEPSNDLGIGETDLIDVEDLEGDAR